MTSMVEKMARALFAASIEPEHDGPSDEAWADLADGWKHNFRVHARAALTALLEPTETMIVAGREVPCDGDVSGGVIYNTENEARATFQAMIHAALDTPCSPTADDRG